MSYAFRAIDSDGDWLFGQGRQSYFTANDAIMADIRTALLMVVGDFFADLSAGVDWWNLTGGMNPKARNEIVRQCRVIIAGITGVVKINSVEFTYTVATRAIVISYNVDTTYSKYLTSTVSQSS